jgi:hypothetical protein
VHGRRLIDGRVVNGRRFVDTRVVNGRGTGRIDRSFHIDRASCDPALDVPFDDDFACTRVTIIDGPGMFVTARGLAVPAIAFGKRGQGGGEQSAGGERSDGSLGKHDRSFRLGSKCAAHE